MTWIKHAIFKGWPCTQITEFQVVWEEALDSSQTPSFHSEETQAQESICKVEGVQSSQKSLNQDLTGRARPRTERSKMHSTPKHSVMQSFLQGRKKKNKN